MGNVLATVSGTGVSVAWDDEHRVVGLRLTRVPGEEEAGGISPAAAAHLWVALAEAGMSVSVRWLVVPRSVVGPPGHVEIHVLVRFDREEDPVQIARELSSLLAVAASGHRFAPLSSDLELRFARRPFEPPAWQLVLEPKLNRCPAHAPGFLRREAPAAEGRASWSSAAGGDAAPFGLGETPDASRAFHLLMNAPGATMLSFDVTAAAPSAKLPLSQEEGAPAGGAVSLPVACRLTLTGSAGRPPRLVASALAGALGCRGGRFVAPTWDVLVPEFLSPSDYAQGVAVVDAAKVPLVMPPPQALLDRAPALGDSVVPRNPRIVLPARGANLGRTSDGRSVRLSTADRMRHLWLLGQTGTGKSTLVLNLVIQDLHAGHGLAVFDPHGDLVDAVLDRVPDSRRSDVTLIDAGSASCDSPAVNLLECSSVEEAHLRAGQILEYMVALWGTEMTGPMFRQALTHGLVLLAVRFDKPGCVADFARIFLDKSFRQEFTTNPLVRERAPQAVRWFEEVYDRYRDSDASTIDYYVSKLSLFDSDPAIRHLFGRSRSTLSFRRTMDEGRVLLCKLGRGGTSPMATAMMTGLYMQATFNAALARGADAVPQSQRRPFFVYCDEFQRIAGPSTGDMLSEVRKYGLGLVLAHQFVDQLPEGVLSAVLGNVGGRVLFRVGGADAERIVRHQPRLTTKELTSLPNYTAIADLLVGDTPTSPFTLCPSPPPAAVSMHVVGGSSPRAVSCQNRRGSASSP